MLRFMHDLTLSHILRISVFVLDLPVAPLRALVTRFTPCV